MKVEPGFRELYEREYQVVFRAAFLLCGDRLIAEDAAQEAFARCLERWSRLGDKPWVGGWVMSTALNHVRRLARRRPLPLTPGEEMADPSASSDPPRMPVEEGAEAAIDLWRGIRLLPLRQQQAVVLHYAMDLAIGDVAAAMRCQEGTVKAHLARARETLRGVLEGRLHEAR